MVIIKKAKKANAVQIERKETFRTQLVKNVN
jgi:hypothetical protein